MRAQVADEPSTLAAPCVAQSLSGATAGVAMRDVLKMLDRVADSEVGVLLRGESGVGKEVIAHELHRRSARREQPFVKVNCAALPADLLESELFGYEKGAFTGAGNTRAGKFEFAHRGTILLDEIGEIPVGLQAKLLHVLQDRSFTRVGGNEPVTADVRVLAATNRDLNAAMVGGTFREDLYYRIQEIEIHVPPLRERRDEIPSLASCFLTEYARAYRRKIIKPSAAFMEALLNYTWPGNIRELENMMKRLVVLQDERMVLDELRAQIQRGQEPAPPAASDPAQSPAPAAVTMAAVESVEASTPVETDDEPLPASVDLQALSRTAALDAEREAIQLALSRFHWNRRKAAVYLKVSYKTLLNKMKECGITSAESTETS
jgi:two-component system response regulator AtoC